MDFLVSAANWSSIGFGLTFGAAAALATVDGLKALSEIIVDMIVRRKKWTVG